MTVTIAVPTVATSAAVIAACRLVLETTVVERAFPFHCKLAEETKFVPVTVSVKPALPATTAFGFSVLTVGTGLLIVNVNGVEVPPPGAGFDTVTAAVPAVATSAGVMFACKLVLETKVVARALPLHCTVEEEMKLDPVTVNVKAAPLAVVELGSKDPDVSDGVRLFAGGGGELEEPPPHPAIHPEEINPKDTPARVRAQTEGRNRRKMFSEATFECRSSMSMAPLWGASRSMERSSLACVVHCLVTTEGPRVNRTLDKLKGLAPGQ